MPRTPRYQHLADELAQAIASGRLPAGAALPSLRECAEQRGVSINTVTSAYRLLEDQGLIQSRPQSGFYVSAQSLPEPRKPLRSVPSGALAEQPAELLACLLAAQGRGDHLDLALACPRGKRYYPSERLGKITRDLLRRDPERLSRYALPPGSLNLRQQIARRGQRLGMALEAQAVVLTHGATEALNLALRAITRPGDCVGIEAPGYFNLYPMLANLGLSALEIPTHPRHGLDLDATERLLQEGRLSAVVSMPSVHNPLGCSMPVAAKQRLAQLAQQYRVPVIEDGVYAELQFCDPPEPVVKAFDREGWVLACGGFSKTLAPDFRLGWLEAGRFVERVQQLKFANSGGEPELLCETVALFLEQGHYEHHIKTLRRLYDQQVASVRALVAQHFPPGTQATQPVGGFLLWVELPPAVDSLELFHAALAERIVIMPGRAYSKGTRYRHCIRLSCCQELDARVQAAIATLGRLASELATAAAAQAVPALRHSG